MAASATRLFPVDSGPQSLVLEFVEVDGMRVRLGHSRPDGRPRGTVVVLPGRAEFIEKYGETLGDLAAAGFAVGHSRLARPGRLRPLPRPARPGLRRPGRGLSGRPRRGAWAGSSSCRLPGPYLMLAHSMGGHIGLRYLHDHPASFRRRGDDARPCSASTCERRRSRWPAPSAGSRSRSVPPRATRPASATSTSPRFVFAAQQADLLPGALRRPAAPARRHARAGAGRRDLWLARRRAALDRADAPTRLPGGDPDPDPGLPGRASSGSSAIVRRTQAVRRLPRGRLVRFPDARHELLLRARPRSADQVIDAFTAFADEVTR